MTHFQCPRHFTSTEFFTLPPRPPHLKCFVRATPNETPRPAQGWDSITMLLDPAHLRLTDFMDLPSLQEIQDSFAAIANVKARITDAEGNLLTQPTPTKEFLRRQQAIEEAEDDGESDSPIDGQPSGLSPLSPQRDGREYVAP